MTDVPDVAESPIPNNRKNEFKWQCVCHSLTGKAYVFFLTPLNKQDMHLFNLLLTTCLGEKVLLNQKSLVLFLNVTNG